MPIRKIVKLKNIGRFANLAAKGDVQFKRLTLIYGPNGYGKTTLAGVLRSLATGDPAYVTERATLGAVDGTPYAEILLDAGKATFSNGEWSETAGELEIYDSTFVNDNVYTGEHVGPEHRKNLYQVIVGAAAVALAREIDDVDAQGRRVASIITEVEDKLRQLIQAPFAVDDFLALEPEDDLDGKIRDRTTQLSAVRKQREILARAGIEPLAAPEFPKKILEVLAADVAEISVAATARVRAHIQQRLDHRGEAWIRQGLEYVGADHQCPFCEQDTSSVDLFRLYQEYFSTGYREHLVDVERAGNLLEQSFGERTLAALSRRAIENDGKVQGWGDLRDLGYARFSVDRLEQAWRRLASTLGDALKRKAGNPSVAISPDSQFAAAIRDYEDAAKELRDHNEKIARANIEIGDLKKRAAATKADELEGELRRLRNMQIRQTPDVAALVGQLQRGRGQKKELDTQKKHKKADLEAMAKSVLERYETSINRLLQIFGANFTLIGTKPSWPGGKASSTYQISINNVPLDLGDSNTPRGKPCFRTALSTGDKSTLALAFFLARLEQDTALATKSVVFDDPLSSLDCFRTTCTQQEIDRISAKAAQTVVLSHDAFFLKRIFDASGGKGATTCLQVVRERDSYALKEWNITDYFLKEAHQEYFQLRSYLEDGAPANGDLTSVARAIRPYLEGNLRSRFPDAFAANDWLGDMIGKVRGAGAGAPLAAITGKLTELDAINDYSKQFHHKGDSPPPRPSDAELRPYVQRALAVVQGA